MIELVVSIIMLIVYILYKIYRYAMRKSEQEKIYWADRKMCGCNFSCKIYSVFKVVLLLMAIGCGLYLIVSLAYGQTPTFRDFSNPKFQEMFFGVGFLAMIQLGIFGFVYFAKKGLRNHRVKVFAFFATITIIAAALLFAIIKAAF